MSYWTALRDSLCALTENDRTGRPVFIRCFVSLPDHEAQSAAAACVQLVTEIMGRDIVKAFSPSPRPRGSLSLSLEFQSGLNAIVTVACTGSRHWVKFLLIGTRGTAAHREELFPEADDLSLPPVSDFISDLIGSALLTDTPVPALEAR